MSILNNTTELQLLLIKANALPKQNNGLELPELNNEGSSSDLLEGKQLIDGDGNVVDGAMHIITEENLRSNINIDSNGLINIIVETDGNEGYINNSICHMNNLQLPTQSSKIITPIKSSQTAVTKNVYTTGVVTVEGIPSQYIDTTDATASESEVFEGEIAYVNGNKVTGTFTIQDEISEQKILIAEIMEALEGKIAGGYTNIETCTITISTDNGDLKWIAYSFAQNGQISYNTIETLQNGNSITLENVIKNSIITLFYTGAASGVSNGGLNKIFDYNSYQGWIVENTGSLLYVPNVEEWD